MISTRLRRRSPRSMSTSRRIRWCRRTTSGRRRRRSVGFGGCGSGRFRGGRVRRTPPELRGFLEAYEPAIAKLFFATRKVVLGAAPGASELVYDAYNAVTVAYSFSERLREAFCHVAAYRGYVNLGFNRGAALADPEGLLVGTGARIRHV